MTIDSVLPFLKKAKDENKSLGEIMIEHEVEIQGVSRKEIIDGMKKIWSYMVNSIKQGVKITKESPSGMSGGNANKLMTYLSKKTKKLSSASVLKIAARAIGIGEFNSSMGVIVAAPTAGSAGVVPAVVYTVAEKLNASEEMIIKGLFASSLIGLVCDARASTSGSEHGCQAEIGVSAAMAAAAAVEIAGGTAEQAVNAAALVLKNTLGLACDPVAGLVEVPCIKRNGLLAVSASVAADLSLAGVQSVIPFDDVVAAMDEIGRMMPCEIKETSEGGLATTKTGLGYKLWLKRSGERQLEGEDEL
ncbi:MAG: L-serine ammonia-lyase, iron-sulfur-dependent, subunit alpha [Candidatus Heimdallarchaeota archaeon]|nr:L-serine ammonia-lyase, iron-sulfur-dependent, subunit alpha [Candidatus Heimdallarchaeota archaeon]